MITASEMSHLLWYECSAVRDFFDTLPVFGNGWLMATVYGYVDKEFIRLNEQSIWSDGPLGWTSTFTEWPPLHMWRSSVSALYEDDRCIC
jgi:hypothetical protein